MSNSIDDVPVIVGVGQYVESLDDANYRGLSVVELTAEAARAALADTAADADAVLSRIDTVAGLRQWEEMTPFSKSVLGKSNNYPRSVAQRLGMDPARAILEVSGGQGPQHLVTEMASKIATGEIDAALIFGGEATSTTLACAKGENPPDFSETVEGSLENRGYGLKGLVSMEAMQHGLVGAPEQYALVENARKARLGLSREEYRKEMGALFASFAEVAANNPNAAVRRETSADELTTPTKKNRWICDPYVRSMVARDKVNQAAAVIVISTGKAQELGIPESKWVYIHGHADLREKDFLDRADLSQSPAAQLASRQAMEMAGVTVDEISTWDFYSCFPIAVFNAAVDGLGLSPGDTRKLTVTGGLPFFGGPGNNYSMHAIAETVQKVRANPGDFGFVGANGGVLSKYSTAIYSAKPCEWRAGRSAILQESLDKVVPVRQVSHPRGWAIIETYTVKYDKQGGSESGIVIGRLEDSDERFVAVCDSDNDEVMRLLQTEEPIGKRVWVYPTGRVNKLVLSREESPDCHAAGPHLRDDYDYIKVEVRGRLLEVTIDRPDARNSLTPQANEELEEVFDYFFQDKDLWVAIITGAGDKAFCAGNDLAYSASGKPLYLPMTGFAGLTHRKGMNKPLIAAVNGFAMGGGFETALACHLIVADETAKFALSEPKVGLVAGAGGVIRLPRIIPEKLANEIILTGKMVTAAQAADIGIVNHVVEKGQALERARLLADEIAGNSPTSTRITLELIEENKNIPDPVDAVNARTGLFDELLCTHDANEGMHAFAEKRKPEWRNM